MTRFITGNDTIRRGGRAPILRPCNLGNEVRHCHLDVELDDVGERVELHCS